MNFVNAARRDSGRLFASRGAPSTPKVKRPSAPFKGVKRPSAPFKGVRRSAIGMGAEAFAHGYDEVRGLARGNFGDPRMRRFMGMSAGFDPIAYANRVMPQTITPRMSMPGAMNKIRGALGSAAVAGGTGYGMLAGGAVTGLGALGKGIGKVAAFGAKHAVLGANIAGLVGGTIMAAGVLSGGGNTSPENLGSQLTAIAEQAAYETSPIAGMGSEMFGVRANPLPSLPSFQKKRGYSPEALAATGDLVLALSASRRG
jgi:hypothetical protein